MGAVFAWALSVQDLDDLREDRARTKALRDARPDLTQHTDRELVDRVLRLFDEQFRGLFGQHIFVTMLATLPVGIINGVCEAVGKPELTLDLLAGFGDVDSAAPSFELWDLGRLVAGSEELTEIFDAGREGLAERLAEAPGVDAAAFRARFAHFLAEHGSRGPNEWETRSPTWETRPALALVAIDRMRRSPESASPAEQNAALAEARAELAAKLAALVEGDSAAHAQFVAALGAAQVWLPARERSKTNAIRLVHEIRVTLREFGRRMVERGHFDQIEDFGFLRRDELEAMLDDPTGCSALIRGRRADYEAVAALEPPFVFVGHPTSIDEWPARDDVAVDQAQSGDVLAGYPGCPGVAEGVARVVLDSSDPSSMEPGDVLVAPITDPSWTPLFVPAAAVVVDVGALQSHAVIVSRELGIPCVVSVTAATRRIPDGARVRVDGRAGTVTVL